MKIFFAIICFGSIQLALASQQVPIWVDAIFWTIAFCAYMLFKMQAHYAKREQAMRLDWQQERQWQHEDREHERIDRRHERELVYQDRAHERTLAEQSRSDERKLLAYVITHYILDMEVARALLEHAKSGTQFVSDGYSRGMLLSDGRYVNADAMPIDQFEAGQELAKQAYPPKRNNPLN